MPNMEISFKVDAFCFISFIMVSNICLKNSGLSGASVVVLDSSSSSSLLEVLLTRVTSPLWSIYSMASKNSSSSKISGTPSYC